MLPTSGPRAKITDILLCSSGNFIPDNFTHKLCFLLLFLHLLSVQVKIVSTLLFLASLYDVKPRHLLFDCIFINDGQTNHTPSFLNSAQKYYIEQFTTFNDNHNDEQNDQTE